MSGIRLTPDSIGKRYVDRFGNVSVISQYEPSCKDGYPYAASSFLGESWHDENGITIGGTKMLDLIDVAGDENEIQR